MSVKPSKTRNGSTAKQDAAVLTVCRRAAIALGLDPEKSLPDSLHRVVSDIGLPRPAIQYLEYSDSEEAVKVCAAYRTLSELERGHVTLDMLILAAKVDPHKIFGVLSEQVSRIEGGAATMLAAVSSPDMVRAAATWGSGPDGHQDRKMILQTAGVAPVPKNQVTRIVNIGNTVDNSRNLTVNGIPSLEDVVKDVDVNVLESSDARDTGPQYTIPPIAVSEEESEEISQD